MTQTDKIPFAKFHLVNSKSELKDFVNSVSNLNADWHEGSPFVEAQVFGTKLDNEGLDDEIQIFITDKKTKNSIRVKLATLLSFATQESKN